VGARIAAAFVQRRIPGITPAGVLLAAGMLLSVAADVPAYEEPVFELVATFDDVEIRRYQPFVVAEVRIDGAFEDTGNRAFNVLFAYISGANHGAVEMDMTAPVMQVPVTGQVLGTTAPLLQTSAADGSAHLVSFALPARFDLTTAPRPTDPRVRLREVPARLMAALRYSGFWSERNFREHEARLLAAVRAQGHEPASATEWARYDSPFTPWFLRRNEVLVEVRTLR
jgi:hypothetical protein